MTGSALHQTDKATTTFAAPPLSIDVRGVTLGYSKRSVLSNLTFSLTERRIAIVGRNGSGKSTLLRLFAGLVAPDTGTIRINGIDVAWDRRAAIKTVGILFQNPDHQIIFPTVAEEIAFGVSQLGHDKAAALDAATAILSRFGCAHWAKRTIAELSQGQRHLVCLMAVLVMEPAVLLLDEPYSALDIPTTRALRRHLSSVSPAVIQVTHDPAAVHPDDRVLWIENGQILADGPATVVMDDYVRAMTEGDDADACADLIG